MSHSSFKRYLLSFPSSMPVLRGYPTWRRTLLSHPDLGFDPQQISGLFLYVDKQRNVKAQPLQGKKFIHRPFHVSLLGMSMQKVREVRVEEAKFNAVQTRLTYNNTPDLLIRYEDVTFRGNGWHIRPNLHSKFCDQFVVKVNAMVRKRHLVEWHAMVKTIPEVWHPSVCNRLGIQSIDEIPNKKEMPQKILRLREISPEAMQKFCDVYPSQYMASI